MCWEPRAAHTCLRQERPTAVLGLAELQVLLRKVFHFHSCPECGSLPGQAEHKQTTLATARAWLGLPGKVLGPLSDGIPVRFH